MQLLALPGALFVGGGADKVDGVAHGVPEGRGGEDGQIPYFLCMRCQRVFFRILSYLCLRIFLRLFLTTEDIGTPLRALA